MMMCPNCSAENSPGAKFCSKCGTAMTAAAAPPAATPAATPAASASPTAAAVSAGSSTSASYWIMVIMVVAILLIAVGTATAWWLKHKRSDAAQNPDTVSTTPRDAAEPVVPSAKPGAKSSSNRSAPGQSAPAQTAQAQPSGRNSCEGVSKLVWMQCKLEGPQTFFKCAPDGMHWNNEIPGCDRRQETRF